MLERETLSREEKDEAEEASLAMFKIKWCAIMVMGGGRKPFLTSFFAWHFSFFASQF
jgi:hypothetical protein